jgi:hypothetical protein
MARDVLALDDAEGTPVVWTKSDKRNRRPPTGQDYAEWLATAWAGKVDVYFSTGTFSTDATREAPNARRFKTLFVDLDCEPANPRKYATQEDALRAGTMFAKGVGLPFTHAVDSGRGVHLYWALKESIDAATYVELSQRLTTLALREGLLLDTAVMADASRVMRAPGTVNAKNGAVAAAYRTAAPSLDPMELDRALPSADAAIVTPQRTDRFSAASLCINAEVLAPEGDLAPSDANRMVAECGALGEVATGDSTISEPLWRAALGVLKFAAGGEHAAHEISAKDSRYTFAETQAKIDAWSAGPATCAEFGRHAPGACATCKHRGKITSPIQLGRIRPDAPPPETLFPSSARGGAGVDLAGFVVPWIAQATPPPPRSFAVGQDRTGMLPLGAVSVMAAPGGYMKTSLAVSICLHKAAGATWAGLRVDPGAVLLVQLEDDAEECQRRAGATLKTQIDPALHAAATQRTQIIALPGVDARLTKLVYGVSQRTDMADRIIVQARQHAASAGISVHLIVVDHSRLAIGGDANDSSHATELLRTLSFIAKETGAAVLLLCHSPKQSLNPKHADEYSAVDVLGSGAFVDNARFAAVLTALTEAERKTFSLDPVAAKKVLALRVIKSNYSEAGRVVYLRKTPVAGWGVAVPDVVTLMKAPAAGIAGPSAPAPGEARLLAYLRANPGRFTRNSIRTQSGRDGPLQMGDKSIVQALSNLIGDGRVVVKAPTAVEVEQYGHGHQVAGVLHAI